MDVKAQLLALWEVVGVTGAVDIALMSVIVYAGLVWLRRSRVSNVIRGALILGAVYLVARQFNLGMTAAVLEAFFVVLLVAAVVIWRDELRRAVERLASFSRRRPRLGRRRGQETNGLAELLGRILQDLAESHTGALVVLRGREPLDDHLEGGVALDGEPSEPLLKSIFDEHSMGHDGAVVIEHGRVRRFAAHLPLSTNFELLGHRGTRHAAGLGLSERTDALCLVVSEERGEISAMQRGELTPLADVHELASTLGRFLGGAEGRRQRSLWALLRGDWAAKLAAVAIAGLLWIVLVHGASPAQRSYSVPIEVADLAESQRLAKIVPDKVKVTFTAARRDFYLFNPDSLRVVLSLPQAHLGTSSVPVTAASLSHPDSLTVKRIRPGHVAVVVLRRPEPPKAKPTAGKKAKSKAK